MASRAKSISRVFFLFLASVGCLNPSVPSSDQQETTDVDFEVLIDELEKKKSETGQEIQEADEKEKCPICCEHFDDSEKISRPCLNSEKHVYHPACIMRWINEKRELSDSCPCCRVPFTVCHLCDCFIAAKGARLLLCTECRAFTCSDCKWNLAKKGFSRRIGPIFYCNECSGRLKEIRIFQEINLNFDAEGINEERRLKKSFESQFKPLAGLAEYDEEYCVGKNKAKKRRFLKAKNRK
jgi:hypothetical protein